MRLGIGKYVHKESKYKYTGRGGVGVCEHREIGAYARVEICT